MGFRVFLVAVVLASCSQSNSETKIVNGFAVDVDDLILDHTALIVERYQLDSEDLFFPKCTAVAVGNNAYVSAKHCIDLERLGDFYLVDGNEPFIKSKSLSEPDNLHIIDSAASKKKTDLVVIKSSKATLGKTATTLNASLPKSGTRLNFAGYGPDVSKLTLDIAKHKIADGTYGKLRKGSGTVSETTSIDFRVKALKGRPCRGDSGSPAYQVIAGKIVVYGLLSRGTPCNGVEGAGDLYLGISKHARWIDSSKQTL